MNDPVTGSCLCGAVSMTIKAFKDRVTACHCSQCRKQSGHYYAAVTVADADIDIDGLDTVRWYRASESAERGFCATCGSVLFWNPLGRDTISVMAGCLDAPTGLDMDAHIFVADKGDYYTLDDGLPQFPASN